MTIDPLAFTLAIMTACAFGFMIAALLGANARERDMRRAYAHGRHPAGRDLPSNVRNMRWEEDA